MFYYVILLMFVFTIYILSSIINASPEKAQKIALIISIIGIVFICGNRAIEVGLDTESYSRLYEWAINSPWTDYDTYWIEPGYTFITKFCGKVLHLNYYQFLLFSNAFFGFSVYKFISKYSKNSFFSILSFVAFPFMAFSISSIRNTIAVGICLLAFPLLEKKLFKKTILFIACIVFAYYIHKSAIVFFAIYFIVRQKRRVITKVLYIVLPLAALVFRSNIYQFININIIKVGIARELSIGWALISLIMVELISFIFINGHKNNSLKNISKSINEIFVGDGSSIEIQSLRIVYWSIIFLLLSNGGSDILARTVLYFEIFIIVLIPNSIETSNLNKGNKVLVQISYIAFLLLYFGVMTLYFDPFGLVPYRFNWQ